MVKVTGIDGIFFKAKDLETMKEWYKNHLGIDAGSEGFSFEWRGKEHSDVIGKTVWAIFSDKTNYFDPGNSSFIINYRVEDLDALVDLLNSSGIKLVDGIQKYEFGRFARILDPEGNKIELWEQNDK